MLDKNCSEYLKLAELAGTSNIEGRTACLQLKMTALVPTDILAQLTTYIAKCKVELILLNMPGINKKNYRHAKRNLK